MSPDPKYYVSLIRPFNRCYLAYPLDAHTY